MQKKSTRKISKTKRKTLKSSTRKISKSFIRRKRQKTKSSEQQHKLLEYMRNYYLAHKK